MQSYSALIEDLLKGDTPKEKYEHLKDILHHLEVLCYPRRGTQDDSFDVYDFANFITPHIKNPNE